MSFQLRALLKLLSTEEGGRDTPLKGAFRPNHAFFGAAGPMHIGQVKPDSEDLIVPGTEFMCHVDFLTAIDPPIALGATWEIYEGRRLIGSARAISLL
ncbi:hypothetical protein [Sphingomonas sp. 37zxx]|uniref:hypothetical protein n=1 Tax=Sphingomonas sp. 37zxx TaxID=1550073 RepID=UPI00053BE220|nr:hypothetical protein [Sphingomonas sp. 37zxx]